MLFHTFEALNGACLETKLNAEQVKAYIESEVKSEKTKCSKSSLALPKNKVQHAFPPQVILLHRFTTLTSSTAQSTAL